MYRKAHLATVGSTLMLAALAAGAALTGTASAAPNGPDQVNIVKRTFTATQLMSNSGPWGRTQPAYGAETGPVLSNLNFQRDDTQDRLEGRDRVVKVTRKCEDPQFSTTTPGFEVFGLGTDTQTIKWSWEVGGTQDCVYSVHRNG